MYVHQVCACWIPRNRDYLYLWATTCMPEIEPESSVRATMLLYSLLLNFLNYILSSRVFSPTRSQYNNTHSDFFSLLYIWALSRSRCFQHNWKVNTWWQRQKERNLIDSVITTESKHNYYPENDKKSPDLNSGNVNWRKRWQKTSKSFSSLE